MSLVARMRAEEDRMQRIFDLCVELRDKHRGSNASTDFNSLKHAISGRDPVLIEAIAALESRPAGVAEGSALADVVAERRRQIEAEGWTAEHDDQHRNGEMASAAACYCAVAGNDPETRRIRLMRGWRPATWPWHPAWWKPTERRRDLVKAGALIIAEIDRLDRLAARVPEQAAVGLAMLVAPPPAPSPEIEAPAVGEAERTAPVSCPNCFNEDDCHQVDVCRAVAEVCSPAVGEAEVVAWQYEELYVGRGGETNWHLRFSVEKPTDHRPDVRSVEPLYLHPAPLRKALEKVRKTMMPFAHAGEHVAFYVPEGLPSDDDLSFPKRGTKVYPGEGPIPFSLTLRNFSDAREALAEIDAALTGQPETGGCAMSDKPLASPERAYTIILKAGADTATELAWHLRHMADQIERDQLSVGCSGGPSAGSIYSYRILPEQTHDAYFRQIGDWLAASAIRSRSDDAPAADRKGRA